MYKQSDPGTGILDEEAFVEEGRDGRIKTRQHSKLWLWKLQPHIE